MEKRAIVAGKIIPLEFFYYREVLMVEKGNIFLQNVNIIFNSKIIKKVRFGTYEMPYTEGMGKEIAIDYLKGVYNKKNDKTRKKRKTSASNVHKDAIDKVVKDLFSELGI